jgi:hypothetical protein
LEYKNFTWCFAGGGNRKQLLILITVDLLSMKFDTKTCFAFNQQSLCLCKSGINELFIDFAPGRKDRAIKYYTESQNQIENMYFEYFSIQIYHEYDTIQCNIM